MSTEKGKPKTEEIEIIKEDINALHKNKETREQIAANLILQIEEKKRIIKEKKKDINKQYSVSQKIIDKIEWVFTSKEKRELSKMVSTAKNDKELEIELAKKSKENIRNKLKKTFLILWITTIVFVALYIRNENYKKNNKKVYNTEQGSVDSSNGQNIDTIPSQIDKVSEEQLEKMLPKDRMNGVSYDQIKEKINALPNKSSRITLIEFLKKWDIIGMQEFVGMKNNSPYSLNTTTGIIDENTLSRITDPMVWLLWNDVMNDQNIPTNIRQAYQEFIDEKDKFNNESFGFISKSNYKLYLFDKNWTLINTQTILVWKDIGKPWERVPYPYYLGTKGEMVYHGKPVNTNTPEWYFIVQRTQGLNKDFIADWPKMALILIPIKWDQKQWWEQENRFDNRFWFWLHFIFKPDSNPDLYKDAIQSPDIPNNVSHGCINTEQNGINIDNLTLWRSIIKVVP